MARKQNLKSSPWHRAFFAGLLFIQFFRVSAFVPLSSFSETTPFLKGMHYSDVYLASQENPKPLHSQSDRRLTLTLAHFLKEAIPLRPLLKLIPLRPPMFFAVVLGRPKSSNRVILLKLTRLRSMPKTLKTFAVTVTRILVKFPLILSAAI